MLSPIINSTNELYDFLKDSHNEEVFKRITKLITVYRELAIHETIGVINVPINILAIDGILPIVYDDIYLINGYRFRFV
jgi:hypothetical protein